MGKYMQNLRDLIIKISANSTSFQSEIQRVTRMGADYNRAMQDGSRRSAAAAMDTQRAIANITSQLNTARIAALSMSGAFAGAFATSHLIKMADDYNSLSSRIKLATTDAADFSDAQKGLMEISQATGSAFADNASLFTRASSSLREWGFGTQDILKLTDALSTGLQVSGASAEETSSTIIQLSQALGRGVLRGQDFNSVAQSGQRIMKALSDGMGVAQKDLKSMADAGQLTTDKIVPALISQLGKLKEEFTSMPDSVSAASNRIQNAFMEWTGGANQATGATATISGAMNAVASNIDTVAVAAGALVTIGISRYFGNWTKGIASNTGELIKNYKSSVNIASAQLNAARTAQRKAVADAEAAESAYNLARAEAMVSKGTNASTVATQNLIQRRTEMIAANAAAVQSNRTLAASQSALNKLTSTGSIVGRGLSALGGLVGGLPGAVMLIGTAWYAAYQQQEQARQSAIEYGKTIDDVKEKVKTMSLSDISGNIDKAKDSLREQNKLVDEQLGKINKIKGEIKDLNDARGKPGITNENEQNILKAIAIKTAELASEEDKLNQVRGVSEKIQGVINDAERERIDRLREIAWKQNDLYQSTIMMNAKYSEFNKLMGIGNKLLSERHDIGISPLMIRQDDLNKKQQEALDRSERDLALSKLKGEAKERARLGYAADDLGLTNEPQFNKARNLYIENEIGKWKNDQANKPKLGGLGRGKSDAANCTCRNGD